MLASASSFFSEHSSTDCITRPLSCEILVAIVINRLSIPSSCSGVSGPNRRRHRLSSARAMSPGSYIVNSVWTSLATYRASELFPPDGTLKLTQRSLSTFTRLNDPVLYDHLSCQTDLCWWRGRIASIIFASSFHYSYQSLHFITFRCLSLVDSARAVAKSPPTSSTNFHLAALT
jgi:hypothetical protein